ncbi:probable glutamate receptor [Panulirus ornatus]|uniref:probable glutamate receptor n=1 Tax=Panulirus ornatus TaxID=150431 RepID=UPI003A8379D9
MAFRRRVKALPRHITASVGDGVVVVDAGSLLSQDQLTQDHLLQGLWGDTRTTCHTLILDLTINNNNNNNNNTSLALRLLETSGLWKLPEARVVVIGKRAAVKDVLLHHSLRNTINVLYLAVHHLTRHTPSRQGREWGLLSVYGRCLYCRSGQMDIKLNRQWNMDMNISDTKHLFYGEMHNMMGHKLDIVTVMRFPYIFFTRDTEAPGTTVTLQDSLDARLIKVFAQALNFTFEIREDPDRSWGLETEKGVHGGMVGHLQREESDLCTAVGPTPARMKILEYLRGYDSDVMAVISLKPSLLPEHLSLIRPFEGELWLAVVVSVVAWGVILWLLQRAWWWVAGGPGVRFNTALLYGWGALLERPPSDPSTNTSGQVLLGWWLVFCLVVNTAYRSSLIAHMTVQGKSKPIETFEDVVNQDGWRWGSEPWPYKGLPLLYFTEHKNPTIRKIYQHMEMMGVDDALSKVLAGSFSLIHWKIYTTIIISSRYTDSRGHTPFYISKQGASIMSSIGWGTRKGAPFYPRFKKVFSRLEDAGLISYLKKDVINRRIRENRNEATLDLQVTPSEESSQVVLGMQHMQGAFYLLFLGYGVSLLTLLGETFRCCGSSPQ